MLAKKFVFVFSILFFLNSSCQDGGVDTLSESVLTSAEILLVAAIESESTRIPTEPLTTTDDQLKVF